MHSQRIEYPLEKTWKLILSFSAVFLPSTAPVTTPHAKEMALTDAHISNFVRIVRRSYQYVAMYNVNFKFAMKQGGWNTCVVDNRLKVSTMMDVARSNHYTLYI